MPSTPYLLIRVEKTCGQRRARLQAVPVESRPVGGEGSRWAREATCGLPLALPFVSPQLSGLFPPPPRSRLSENVGRSCPSCSLTKGGDGDGFFGPSLAVPVKAAP